MSKKYLSSAQRSKQAGFSLLEITIVATVVLAATAAAFLNIMPSIRNSRSMRLELVLGEMRRAHERAVMNAIYRVTFASNTIQVDVGTVAVVSAAITDGAPVSWPRRRLPLRRCTVHRCSGYPDQRPQYRMASSRQQRHRF
jgi:type II secretory pathway pseudopilin PulG